MNRLPAKLINSQTNRRLVRCFVGNQYLNQSKRCLFQVKNIISNNIQSSNKPLTYAIANNVSINYNYIQKHFYATNYPEHIIVTLPALSPTMEQGTLAKWCKNEGDQISEGDLIAEIETDKATMGLESAEEGFIAKILVPEKTKEIPLKTNLVIIVKDKSHIDAFKNYSSTQASKPSAAPAAKPAEAIPIAPPVQQPKAATTSAPPPPPPPPTAHQVSVDAPKSTPDRIFATPLAKKLASERAIDLSNVQGSGPEHQIRANDILNFVAKEPVAKAKPEKIQTTQMVPAEYKDIPLNNIRAVTAKRLLLSKQTIPHYYLSIDFEVDNALRIRKELNESLAKDNIKLSVNDIVIKAAAFACKKVPEANSAWMDTFIRQYSNVDICVAVATENGLITPIIFNADKKGLASINLDVTSLAQKARAGKLMPHEFQGGTFTISNLGMFGIKNFSAVINPPQVCILAVGGIEKRLVPTESGGHKTVSTMSVTLSCDHRVVDGAVGAKWLEHFKRYMENPASMLL